MRYYRPLYLSLIPVAVVAVMLTAMFAYVGHVEHLPLWDEVPIKFTAGACVLTWLLSLATYLSDPL